MTTPRTIKKTTISAGQRLALIDWLRANRETLEALTYKEITVKAVAHFNFALSDKTVEGIVKLLGWAPKRKKPAAPEDLETRVAALEARLAALEDFLQPLR